MAVVRATEKGHVMIPAYLRKKHHITKGSRISVYEGEKDVIILKLLPEDPIAATRGILKGKTSLLNALLKDRQEDLKHG